MPTDGAADAIERCEDFVLRAVPTDAHRGIATGAVLLFPLSPTSSGSCPSSCRLHGHRVYAPLGEAMRGAARHAPGRSHDHARVSRLAGGACRARGSATSSSDRRAPRSRSRTRYASGRCAARSTCRRRSLSGATPPCATVTIRPGPFPLELPKLPGPPKLGSAAPALDLEIFRGEADLAAPRPRLLFFWATWCGICKHAVPEVLAYERTHDVQVVAITDEDAETLRPFFRDRRAEFPAIVARDPQRRVFQRYGVSGTPTFVLVDGGGIIRHYQTGYPAAGLQIEGWHWREEMKTLSDQ